jgi:hypothetical protein
MYCLPRFRKSFRRLEAEKAPLNAQPNVDNALFPKRYLLLSSYM